MPKMYDEDSLDQIQETSIGLVGCNATAATGITGRFATYMNAKISEITFIRHGLGTDDASGFDIYRNGTDSLDAVVLGTAVVGSIVRATLADITDWGPTDHLTFQPIVSDTTCSAFISVTWQERFDGSS